MPKEGGVASLFALMKLFEMESELKKFTDDYKSKKIQYSMLKEALAMRIYHTLFDFREKRKEFEGNPELVDSIIKESVQKCQEEAAKTISDVRSKMGL